MVFTDGIHLIAEDVAELHRFARSIGLKACWFHSGSRHPHYDLLSGKSPERRRMILERAVEMGAIVVTTRMLVKISRRCYFFPETEEEIEEFERRNKWALSQMPTPEDEERMDRMWREIISRISKKNPKNE